MELYILSILLVVAVIINQAIVYHFRRKLDKTHEHYNNQIIALKKHKFCMLADEAPEDQGALIIKQMNILSEINSLKKENRNHGRQIKEIEKRRRGKG